MTHVKTREWHSLELVGRDLHRDGPSQLRRVVVAVTTPAAFSISGGVLR